jgi:MbtH protein
MNGSQYAVVVNHEEQYSIWSADEDPPAGWRREGFVALSLTVETSR